MEPIWKHQNAIQKEKAEQDVQDNMIDKETKYFVFFSIVQEAMIDEETKCFFSQLHKIANLKLKRERDVQDNMIDRETKLCVF